MARGLRAAAACVCVALLATGCGGTREDDGPAEGPDTLTIYSSLPLQGRDERAGRDMVKAIKLALREAGGKAGPFSVTYVPLDAASAEAGTWTGDKVLDNARTAVRDLNAIAYIGDRDSAATALSLPLTNEGHVLQVSPSSTYDGLTRPSRRQGEPDRFYPSGLRTFGRVVPADNVQAAALVDYMRQEGVRRVAVLSDRELYGSGLADEFERAAVRGGLTIVADGRIDANAEDHSKAAREVAASGADAFLFAGARDEGAVRIYGAVGAAAPGMLLFAPAAVGEPAFARALPPSARARMRITSPDLPVHALPPAAREFHERFAETFGHTPSADALPAYEAASAVLHAIRSAGDRGNDRSTVTAQFFAIRNRRSVLGTYSIDGRGDTSLRRYAGLKLRGTELVVDRVLTAPQ